MNTATILCLALCLDALLGEPKWLWQRVMHPAVAIGKIIDWADTQFNTGTARRLRGVGVILALVLAAWFIGKTLSVFGWLPQLIVVAILLAQRSLVDHVRAVGDALRLSVEDGRSAVAMIVSRDTAQMDASDVTRSAIESAAENFSDGVLAPAFWFLIGGLPGILIYKAVNTADSMIGYRSEKYRDFGWAAARLDDVLNWLPARLSAFLIGATHSVLSEWRAVRADARKHKSPNAGWPESALARALNVAIAGPRVYDGEKRDFPFVNVRGRMDLGPHDITATCAALWRSWGVALGFSVLLAIVL